ALAAGVLLTLPIGGADMPVVISLLNACTGTAVAMAGFVLESTPLIIAGGLVGAAGAILTKLMADAMNRPITAIIAGGYGTGDTVTAAAATTSAPVREITADDAAIQLAYAAKVVIVPGYGLAAAQAQHEAVALAEALTANGV
ncbi:NAD(P)(+) transhydrogenase (Re/Si-specific) subunit beta, partial [Actinoplanes sp. KI2]|uniref:NAD(P)(+) transhydrogenase (Re/Si-specific) subunit beta n=1 Tax=Actinoplanes sp. KI2 TaxID=2983315 RepID=UPI0021D5D79B